MLLSEIYNVKGDRSKINGDGILSVISGASLLITQKIDISLDIFNFRIWNWFIIDLVNGVIIEFYGFADKDDVFIRDEIITIPRVYILIKLKHDIDVQVIIPGLSSSVIGIEPVSLIYNNNHDKKMIYIQFPAILVYAITDYKCQG